MADPSSVLGLPPGPTYDYGEPPPAAGDRAVRVLVVAGALVVGFLAAAGLAAGHRAAEVGDARRDDLVALVEQRQARGEQLAQELDEVQARVAAAEAEEAQGLPVLSAQVAEAETLAGVTAVAGPGVVVTLADAGEGCTSDVPEDCRILDSDVQGAVNTLFGAGAEAVTVNGERVIAITAVRSAGSAVLVNYRVQTSPYVVEAVGDPAALEAGVTRSTFGIDFRIWAREYGLGFEVASAGELTLPEFRGAVRLRSAAVPTPVPGPTPTAAAPGEASP